MGHYLHGYRGRGGVQGHYLHTVNNQSRGSVQFLVAHMTLEVPGLLMLHQDLLILKLSVTVPTPWLQRLLLLTAHATARGGV